MSVYQFWAVPQERNALESLIGGLLYGGPYANVSGGLLVSPCECFGNPGGPVNCP